MDKITEREWESIEELQNCTLPELEQILAQYDELTVLLKAKKETALERHRELGLKTNHDWLHRLSLKLNITKKKRGAVNDLLRSRRGTALCQHFIDLCRIVLPPEQFNELMNKAKALAKGAKR